MPSPEERLGRYLLLERLATGGTAEVLRARVVEGPDAGALVAVKRLLPGLAAQPAAVHQLARERAAAAALHHPAICALLDAGEEDGRPYLVLELAAGPTLRRAMEVCRLRARALPLPLVQRVGRELCEALVHAATAGVVHGDLSPQNVLLTVDGAVKLVDFGGGGEPGEVRGKVGYLAPEQLGGAPAAPAADLYAGAVILWELLANARLFPAAGLPAAARARRAPVTSPARGLPALEAALARALSREPALRPAPGELRDLLAPGAATVAELAAWVRDHLGPR